MSLSRYSPTPSASLTSAPEWRILARVLAAAAVVGAIVGSVGCSGDANPVAPSGSAIATVRVVNEQYRLLLTTPEQIAAARAAQAGGPAIPNGRLVSGTQVNTGYDWHVEDVQFAEVTIEVCDGLPSHVQREGVRFGGGRYCPWSAQIISIQLVP